MNVLYILNNRFPTIKAHGLQVAKTCESFQKNGAEVELIIPIRNSQKEIRGISIEKLYGIKTPFKIRRLPSFDFAGMYLNSRFLFLLQQVVFAIVASISIVGKKGIVYSRDPFTLYVLSFFRKDIFWEIHRMPENIQSRVYRRLLPRLSGMIAISNGLKKSLSTHIDPSKIIVAHDGFDPEQFVGLPDRSTLRSKLGLPQDKTIVMYVGHLFEWKGADTFVAAVQHLPETILSVVGGGTKDDVAQLQQQDISGKVRFEGFIPFQMLPEYLAAADLLVLPNKKDGGVSEFYTSPLKLFAYMASGKAIIASDLPSLKEVLNDTNALFFKPNDPESLKQHILVLAGDAGKMQQLGVKAQADVAKYSWAHRGKEILSFISSTIL